MSSGVAPPAMRWLKSLIPSAETTARNTGNDHWLRQIKVLLSRRRDRPAYLNNQKTMAAYLFRNLAVSDEEARQMAENLWPSYTAWMQAHGRMNRVGIKNTR